MRSIGAVLGDGSDSLNLSAVGPATFPQITQVNVDLADSDDAPDVVNGSQFRDLVTAENDDTVIAGAGDDLITGAGSASGGEGDDVMVNVNAAQGGPGDDRIINFPGIGPYDGGDGYDRFDLDLSDSDLSGLVLFGDTYTDTSTTLTISDGVTVVTASAATTGLEQMNLDFPSGPPGQHYELDGSAFSGRSVLGTGNGPDLVRTGPGPDDVQTGAGNDIVDSGPGADVLKAGNGNDTVGVRDGTQDLVDCGGGTDTVTADAVDVLTGCESVSPAGAGDREGVRAEEGGQGCEGDLHLLLAGGGCDLRVQGRQGRVQGLLEPVQAQDQEAQDREAHAARPGGQARRQRRRHPVVAQVQGGREEVAPADDSPVGDEYVTRDGSR